MVSERRAPIRSDPGCGNGASTRVTHLQSTIQPTKDTMTVSSKRRAFHFPCLSRQSICAGSLALLAALAAVSSQAAVVLGDAGYHVDLSSGNTTINPNIPGSFSLLGQTAQLAIAPAIIMDASVHGPGIGDEVGGSNVQLGYYWTVEGGIAGTVVPVLIDVYASVTATNGNDHSTRTRLPRLILGLCCRRSDRFSSIVLSAKASSVRARTRFLKHSA